MTQLLVEVDGAIRVGMNPQEAGIFNRRQLDEAKARGVRVPEVFGVG